MATYCRQCKRNEIALRSKSRCDECLAKARETMRRVNLARRAEGRCGSCGAARDVFAHKTCSKCIAKALPKRKTAKKPYMGRLWWSQVDWTLPVKHVADLAGVSMPAAYRQFHLAQARGFKLHPP